MSTAGNPPDPAILVVRLGAMGDIIHTLPAVRALKLGYPHAPLTWVVEPKWAPLLEQNPFVDRIVTLDRGSFQGLAASHRALRQSAYRFAVDFQGLLKSALVAVAAQPEDLRLRPQPGARTRRRDLLSAQNLQRRRPTWWTAISIWPLPPARFATVRRFSAAARPSGRRSPGRRVRTGFPTGGMGDRSNGRWRIIVRWPTRLRSELGIPLVLNGPPGAPFGDIAPALAHYSGCRG
jgi:heptosyltransferase I